MAVNFAKRPDSTCKSCTDISVPKKGTKELIETRQKVTKIVVKCNCGFPNNLFIRGEGIAGLTWERGMPMKNVKADEWLWETDKPFTKGQFKVLINDKVYEQGNNHMLSQGQDIAFTPKF
jgi:hypothetical protein